MRSTFAATTGTKRPIDHNWWSIFLVFSLIGLVVGTPLQRVRRLEMNIRRDLQSLMPGAEIPPSLVDLQDQWENLSGQLATATPGTLDFDELTVDVDEVQNKLINQMSGVAVFVTPAPQADGTASTIIADDPSPTETPTLPPDLPPPQLPGVPEPLPPTLPVITNTPQSSPKATVTAASTVATQEITTVIVTTLLGGTNTITLATRTVLPTLITSVIQVPGPTSVATGRASPKAVTIVASQGATTTLVPTPKGTVYGASSEVENGALLRGPSEFILVGAMIASLSIL